MKITKRDIVGWMLAFCVLIGCLMVGLPAWAAVLVAVVASIIIEYILYF